MLLQKVEIRFEKGDSVRFISHHDLMRAMQRAVRRADLPVRLTGGFNPRPRIIFPSPLEVGVTSCDEAVEIEFTQCLPIQEIRCRLERHLPPGLQLTKLETLPLSTKAQLPERNLFRIQLTSLEIHPQLNLQLEALLKMERLPYRRIRRNSKGRTVEKETDLRPYLAGAKLEDSVLDLEILQTPLGTARPLEMLSLLLNKPLEQLKHLKVFKLQSVLRTP